MDEMMNQTSVYGPIDPQPQENPYTAFQSFSGSRLTAEGPTTATDQTAYGNNDPRFYTKQEQNLNNAGPPSFYQPIQPGYGAGVSPTPSPFSPNFYLRVHNRDNRAVRVSKGVYDLARMPSFAPPKVVDDSALFEFVQTPAGTKIPLLIELPSKSIYFKTMFVPTMQNQAQLYLPFEQELVERNTPSAQIAGVRVYADNALDLQTIAAYLHQFVQNGRGGQGVGSISTANSALPLPAGVPVTPQAAAQIAAAQAAQIAAAQTAGVAAQAAPAAPSGPNPLMSALLLIGGVIASHYLENLGE
jgi:hypothetical protein